MAGSLTLVATPIGNLEDLTFRAKSALESAELWIVEDTRQSGKLQAHLGIKKPMAVLNDHTSEVKVKAYVGEISAGRRVVLLTDAGCPAISDPGARLADLCHEQGLEVDAVPGASAVTTALMLSGFYAQRFVFLGYLPRKAGAARKEIFPYIDSPFTIVMFESAMRSSSLLAVLSEALGERRYALCRELTKVHQQVYRGRFPDIPEVSSVPRKGEWTIVVEGKRR